MTDSVTARPRQWELLPDVDLGGAYDAAEGAELRWVADLARLFARKPKTVGVFFRAGFASVTIQALSGPLTGDESGSELDARATASVRVHGADCGDP